VEGEGEGDELEVEVELDGDRHADGDEDDGNDEGTETIPDVFGVGDDESGSDCASASDNFSSDRFRNRRLRLSTPSKGMDGNVRMVNVK